MSAPTCHDRRPSAWPPVAAAPASIPPAGRSANGLNRNGPALWPQAREDEQAVGLQRPSAAKHTQMTEAHGMAAAQAGLPGRNLYITQHTPNFVTCRSGQRRARRAGFNNPRNGGLVADPVAVTSYMQH